MNNTTNTASGFGTNKCDVCGCRCRAVGRCRTHKFAVRRAAARVKAEGLIVDMAGGAWWVWDAKGEVLVIGESSRPRALAALDLGTGTEE